MSTFCPSLEAAIGGDPRFATLDRPLRSKLERIWRRASAQVAMDVARAPGAAVPVVAGTPTAALAAAMEVAITSAHCLLTVGTDDATTDAVELLVRYRELATVGVVPEAQDDDEGGEP